MVCNTIYTAKPQSVVGPYTHNSVLVNSAVLQFTHDDVSSYFGISDAIDVIAFERYLLINRVYRRSQLSLFFDILGNVINSSQLSAFVAQGGAMSAPADVVRSLTSGLTVNHNIAGITPEQVKEFTDKLSDMSCKVESPYSADQVRDFIDSATKIEVDHKISLFDGLFDFLYWNKPIDFVDSVKYLSLALAIGAIGHACNFKEQALFIGRVLEAYWLAKGLKSVVNGLVNDSAYYLGKFVAMFGENCIVSTIIDYFSGTITPFVAQAGSGVDSVTKLVGGFMFAYFASSMDIETMTIDSFLNMIPSYEKKHKSVTYCLSNLLDYVKTVLSFLIGRTGISCIDNFIHGDPRLADLKKRVNDLCTDSLFGLDPTRNIMAIEELDADAAAIEIEFTKTNSQLLPFVAKIRQSLSTFLASKAAAMNYNVEPPVSVILMGGSGIGKTVLRHNLARSCAILGSSVDMLNTTIANPNSRIATLDADKKYGGDLYDSSKIVITMDELQTTAVNTAQPPPGFALMFGLASGTPVTIDGVGVEAKNKIVNVKFFIAASNAIGGFARNWAKQSYFPDAALRRLRAGAVFVTVKPEYCTQESSHYGIDNWHKRELDKTKVEYTDDGESFDHLLFAYGDPVSMEPDSEWFNYDTLLLHISDKYRRRQDAIRYRGNSAFKDAVKFAQKFRPEANVEVNQADVLRAQGVDESVINDMVAEDALDEGYLGAFTRMSNKFKRSAVSIFDNFKNVIYGHRHLVMASIGAVTIAAGVYTFMSKLLPTAQSSSSSLYRKVIRLSKSIETPSTTNPEIEAMFGQAGISANIVPFAASLENRNVGAITTTMILDNGSVKVHNCGFVLAVGGGCFVTASHVLGAIHATLKSGGSASITFKGSPHPSGTFSKAITLWDLERDGNPICYHGVEGDGDADIACFKLDVAPFRSIEDNFIYERELTSASDFAGVFLAPRDGAMTVVSTRVTLGGVKTYELADGSSMSNIRTLTYPIPTVHGDCGSVIVVETRKGPQTIVRIAGMHVAGGRGIGISVPLTRETIIKMKACLLANDPVVSNDIISQGPLFYPKTTKFELGLRLPQTINSNVMVVSEMSAIGDAMSEYLHERTGEPVVKYGVRTADRYFGHKAVSSRQNDIPAVNRLRLKYASSILATQICSILKNNPTLGDRGVCTLAESVQFDTNKSASIGARGTFGKELFGHKSGLLKTDFIGFGGGDPESAPYWPNLVADVDRLETEFSAGIINPQNPCLWNSTFPKTEVGPLKNGVPKEARTIYNPDIAFNCLVSKYYGRVAESLCATGICIDMMNPYTDGKSFCLNLARNCVVKSVSELMGLDADYSGWDKNLLCLFMMEALELVCRFITGLSEHDRRILVGLNSVLIYPYILVNVDESSLSEDERMNFPWIGVARVVSGQTSGNRLTSLINSIANKLLSYYIMSCISDDGVWASHMDPLTYPTFKFYDHFVCHVHGDDIVIVGSLADFTRFNLCYTKFAFVAQQMKFVPQPASKNGKIVELKTLLWDKESDPNGDACVIFLKRRFVKDGKEVICPLDINSLIRQLYFETSSFNKLSDLDKESRWAQFFVELSLHGREIFEKFAPSISQALLEQGIKPVMADSFDLAYLSRLSISPYV